VVLLVLLAGSVVALQIARERQGPAPETARQLLYVSSPAVMTRMALSFDAIASDIYWIRAIQYYGSTRLSKSAAKNYDLLFPLLDLTTSLDPQFTVAYRFGAFFLSERAPGGAGRPDLSIALLDKAIAANPRRWEYPYDIGFVYYREGDYRHAAEWFEKAAQVPGATNWLRPLAAVTAATGGDLESSRLLWRNILATADQDWMRAAAEHRLQQLDAIDAIRRLEALTAAYERSHGAPPQSWDELVRTGALPGIPLDPAGQPYALNPWWGSVTVNRDSPMWPLPTEGAR
jgi:tetratricopeptide (TPR) repeat protein